MATSRTVSERLASWVVGLDYDDLPADVVAMAKRLVLDQLGLQLRGSTLPNVQPVCGVATMLGGGGEATVTGSSTRLSAPQAAWVNGTLGHSAEYDDAHMSAWHTSSAVVPAALAAAEREGHSGSELITAVVAGVQVMGVLGSVAGNGMLTRGWHGSKVLGVFGAAAAAGRILGLDAAQLTNAFGIAASDAGGTMEYDRSGGEVKRLHAGSASRTGVEAALLAQWGLTGPVSIFEGPRGVFAMFGGAEDGAVPADEEWDRWQILATMFRFYPAVAATHPPLDALRRLRAQEPIDPADVVAITVGLPAWAVGHGAAIVRPNDAISAQFSLAFGLGLQLVTGHNRPQDYFDPRLWSDPEILRIADAVVPVAMEIPDGDPNLSARVEIELRDGRRLSAYQAGFHGHPVWPATGKDIEDKFRANLDGVTSEEIAQAIIGIVTSLEHAASVRDLTALLRSAA
ncbi:MAG TPA: MmgE/PrpD family protein [Trebonia sp.]